MSERFLQAVRTDDPGAETPAATRERFRGRFAPGALRRTTQLGLLVGALVDELAPGPEDSVVYASRYGESRALEAFLDSFPAASPTLFQTSIHPSGVQQGLIHRQRPVAELFPLSGSRTLVGSALTAALLAPAPRVLLCGGEERATWLTERSLASDRTFAFALALLRDPAPGSAGRLALLPSDEDGLLSLAAFFDVLHNRRAFAGPVAPGWRLELAWT